ncbi:glucosyltransferase domain-containing protein [Oscillibacter sp. GMB15532]|uniref:glucosyltransferase domain-containing protein n=1 Tax=Oscillibacter sp. GMB15532 TaxID=3230022 RepID=UPI0034DEAA94
MQKKEQLTAYISACTSTFFCGLFAHGYILTNTIINHDSMPVIRGSGDGVALGRWMWTLWLKADLINTPWFNGMTNIILMALTATLLIYIFQVKSPIRAALIGGAWVTCVANTTLFLYCQLIPVYSLGILLSVLAVYLLKKLPGIGGIIGFLLCGILAMGAYQAYFELTATCLLLNLAIYIYTELPSFRNIAKKGFYYLSLLLTAMLGYLGVTNLICSITHIPMATYQGLDGMGIMNIETIFNGISKSYLSFFTANSAIWNAAICKLLDVSFGVVWAAGAIYLVIDLIQKKKKICALCCGLIALLFPISSNLVYFYGAEFVHSLMLYGNIFLILSLLIFVPVKERESVSRSLIRALCGASVVVLSLLLLLSNTLLANQAYTSQEKRQNAAIEYWKDVVTEIKHVEEYSAEMPIALVGYNEDSSIRQLDIVYFNSTLAGMTSAEQFLNFPIYHDWLRPGFFMNQVGFSGTFATFEESMQLKEKAEIQAMPIYPQEGSIAVVDGVLVVHFSNL